MRLVRLTLDCGVHYIMIVSAYPLNYLTFEESNQRMSLKALRQKLRLPKVWRQNEAN